MSAESRKHVKEVRQLRSHEAHKHGGDSVTSDLNALLWNEDTAIASLPMSLPITYSSDEEDHISSVKSDLFSLSALPTAKKPRVDETQLINTNAAPHVLAEVTNLHPIPFYSIC